MAACVDEKLKNLRMFWWLDKESNRLPECIRNFPDMKAITAYQNSIALVSTSIKSCKFASRCSNWILWVYSWLIRKWSGNADANERFIGLARIFFILAMKVYFSVFDHHLNQINEIKLKMKKLIQAAKSRDHSHLEIDEIDELFHSANENQEMKPLTLSKNPCRKKTQPSWMWDPCLILLVKITLTVQKVFTKCQVSLGQTL